MTACNVFEIHCNQLGGKQSTSAQRRIEHGDAGLQASVARLDALGESRNKELRSTQIPGLERLQSQDTAIATSTQAAEGPFAHLGSAPSCFTASIQYRLSCHSLKQLESLMQILWPLGNMVAWSQSN